ncbi:hypothetical protein VPH35_015042 [Triticum aestivum]
MRAHPTWQRPLGVTSLSFFTPFSLLARSPRLLHALTSDLLDLIIIEISSDNYQYKSRRRARRRRRDPHVHAGEDAFLAAGSTRDHREPPDPPRAIRSTSHTGTESQARRIYGSITRWRRSQRGKILTGNRSDSPDGQTGRCSRLATRSKIAASPARRSTRNLRTREHTGVSREKSW